MKFYRFHIPYVNVHEWCVKGEIGFDTKVVFKTGVPDEAQLVGHKDCPHYSGGIDFLFVTSENDVVRHGEDAWEKAEHIEFQIEKWFNE